MSDKAPKNPGKITFTVDGKEVVAAPGTNLIDAAKSVGIHIPYYCYHPCLSVAANCRMCMVETSLAPPGKIVPACQTSLVEGMAVQSETPTVKKARRDVMEFLLLNHPVDCSICDQSGECKLQDYYMRYDYRRSRLEGSKILRRKRKVLSEHVIIDQERCILCTRCVRFMREVAKTDELGVFGRGSAECVDLAPGIPALSSKYSGNIVDICPVGALLNRDFRFRARSWFLSTAPSVCAGCSRGCNTYADFMGQDVYRYRPRENNDINKVWLCDAGRLSYKELAAPRPLAAAVDGAEVRPEIALEAMKQELLRLESGVLVGISPTLSNEAAFTALTFANEILKVSRVYVTGRANGQADDFLITADKNPNRRGLTTIAKALGVELLSAADFEATLKPESGVLLFGHDLPSESLASHLAKVTTLLMVASASNDLTQRAKVLLPASHYLEEEGTFMQEAGFIQRFRRAFPPKGEAQPIWRWIAHLGSGLSPRFSFTSEFQVFATLKDRVPEFQKFDWNGAAPPVQMRPGIGTLPAAADGRPPGWREQGVPNVRGLTVPR